MTVNVNDILFRKARFSGLEKVVVIKITPNGNIRVSDGSLLTPQLGKKTSDAWDSTMYYPWSQELEDKYKLQNMQANLSEKVAKLKVSELNETSVGILLKAFNEID